jgi:hypothetical protein
MSSISTPVLVLTGVETWPGLRTSARGLTGRISGARHVEVPGGQNHEIPPAATAAALRPFLRPR